MQRKTRNRIVWGLAGLAVLGFLVFALRPRPVPVEVAAAERDTFVETVDEEGRTRARERYVVSAPVTGLLNRIQIHPGDPVAEGQVVASLAPVQPPLLDTRSRAELEARALAAQAARRTAEARLEQAEARATFAVSEAERSKVLHESDVASARDVDQARAEAQAARQEVAAARFAVRVAAYEVDQARAALRQAQGARDGACCEVRAPIAGQVLRVVQESEGVVAPGAPLLEIGDIGDLEVVVDVLTEDAPRIRPGAPVRLTAWGGDAPLEGRVRRVEPAGRTEVSALGVEEQRVDVVVDLVSARPLWAELGDGYRLEAAIEARRVPDAIVVPTGALFRSGEGWAVFRVESGTARTREVGLGPRDDGRAVIEEGLSPGDVVVVHPGDAVADGVRVALP